MVLSPMMKRAYHVEQGAVEMYAMDANHAVATHPDEWSWEPWSVDDTAKARQARIDAHKKAVAEAEELGLPPPRPPVLPPIVEPSPAQKAELEADAKERAKAAEIVRAAEEKERIAREEDEKVAAAKAKVASPPPQIDPNERRPFGRPGPMTPAEREQAARRAAAKAKEPPPVQPQPVVQTPAPPPGPAKT